MAGRPQCAEVPRPLALPRPLLRPLALAVMLLLLLCWGCQDDEDDDLQEEDTSREVTAAWDTDPFTWSATFPAYDQRLAATPGKTWSLPYKVEVDLRRHEEKYGRFTHLVLGVIAERRYDAGGFFRSGASTFALSSNLSTTGVAIERFDTWPRFRLLHQKNGSPFEGVKSYELPADGVAKTYTFQGTLTVKLPAQTPAGTYEPGFYVLARVEGVANPIHLGMFGFGWDDWRPLTLPWIKVGTPKEPRLPWTILSKTQVMGRAGALAEEYRGKAALCARSGFNPRLILPPGSYPLMPGFPTVFIRDILPQVDGGNLFMPEQIRTYLRFDRGSISCRVVGPGGEKNLGSRQIAGRGELGPDLEPQGFQVDLTRPGDYTIHLKGNVEDRLGRTFHGGGTYKVTTARPLTFSTSCKPGTSFLVGGKYPPKVNVLPPFPAQVTVTVDFFPNSDPSRKKTWSATGRANRFGHFVPHGKELLVFDEPGEYRSRVNARHVDHGGGLWMGEQVSVGVVAPLKQEVLRLHGTRSFPFNPKLDERLQGAVKRFAYRQRISIPVMPQTPYVLMDAFAPYYGQDTYFIPSNFSEDNTIEPHMSMEITDKKLARRLAQGYAHASAIVPPPYQPVSKPWRYLRDMVQISTDNFAWFSIKRDKLDELPMVPLGKDGWHPASFPEKKTVEGYGIMGVVRPGFPVMTSVFQTEATGFYWQASPNRFGNHYGTWLNGDLKGDIYRMQAGAVLRDLTTGKNYYDAYAASIAVVGTSDWQSISPPGVLPLVTIAGREHRIFLATDTHDTLEVGEMMGFGGMIFPNIPAETTWTVTRPNGEVVVVRGQANRLGIVGGHTQIPVDVPGIYSAKVRVKYGKLRGDVVGTRDGTFWHCAVPKDNPAILSTTLGPMTRIDLRDGIQIPLTWPAELKDVRLHFGMIMPGQVLDQGVVRPRKNQWRYPFHPVELAAQFSNFDVRFFGTGTWGLADTVVFQFFLEGTGPQGKVYDSLRLVVRRDTLYNYRKM